MDPVSHVVFGWSVTSSISAPPPARGRGLAIAFGALSPDVDVLLMPAGWDRYLAAHEAGTHSVLGAVICGALAAGLAALIRRPARHRALAGPAVAAALSHVAADLLSGASIRVAWPLLDARVENLGVAAMGDPYVIALFAVGGLAMWTMRQRRAHCARGLLLALAMLVAVKTVSRERAVAAYRERESAGGSASYLVEPVWASFDWRVLESRDMVVRSLRLAARRPPLVDAVIARRPPDAEARAIVDASAEWEPVRNFLGAHDFAFGALAVGPGGTRTVAWSDIRYCRAGAQRPADCAIEVGGIVDPSGGVRTFARVGEWTRDR